MNLKFTPVSTHGRLIEVTVSRTNIEEMLKKLNGFPPDSSFTLVRDTEHGRLVLRAEEDEEHYNSPDRDAAARGIRGITYSEYAAGETRHDIPVSEVIDGRWPEGYAERPVSGETRGTRLIPPAPSLHSCISYGPEDGDQSCGCDGECERAGRGLFVHDDQDETEVTPPSHPRCPDFPPQ